MEFHSSGFLHSILTVFNFFKKCILIFFTSLLWLNNCTVNLFSRHISNIILEKVYMLAKGFMNRLLPSSCLWDYNVYYFLNCLRNFFFRQITLTVCNCTQQCLLYEIITKTVEYKWIKCFLSRAFKISLSCMQ